MGKIKNAVFGVRILPQPWFSTPTDTFGQHEWRVKAYGGSGNHFAIDLAAPIGTSVRTPHDGTVIQVIPEMDGGGNTIKIDHGEGFMTRYLHLDKFLVKQNEKVKAGAVIALTGNTIGKTGFSTGPHLHFEVWENGKRVDPAPYLYGYALKQVKKNGKNTIVPDLSITFTDISTTDPEIQKIANSTQLYWASIIINTCKKLNGTQRDAKIGIMAAMQESALLNLGTGDLDSRGLFQQRPSMGWGTVAEIDNAEFAATSFFNGRNKNKGLFSIKNRESFSCAECCQKVQKSKYPTAYAKHETNAGKIVDYFWGVVINSERNESATENLENVTQEVEITDYQAPGIWGIIKMVIDPEIKDRQINDASVSFLTGSLFSFFEKLCQKPFVEFFGDTYGDQYYFVARKPPFTRQSFLSLPTITIKDEQVFSDSFSWNNDEVYSWFQLEPNGNYIGGEQQIWQYLSAVFFPEYAELWGSKPLSVTTNYITFIKETGKVLLKEAEKDLQFMIDIHSYLPFTRKGTITIRGDRRFKRGMKIFYEPTGEYFYVDSVTQTFQSAEGILNRTTVLQVSRGMVAMYADIEIEDQYTPSYFNLINYGPAQYENKQSANDTWVKPKDAPNIDRHVAYFNQDKYVFPYTDIEEGRGLEINSGDLFLGTSADPNSNDELKVTKAIVDANFAACDKIVDYLNKYPNLVFELVGNCDEIASIDYNIILGQNRAITVRDIIVEKYSEKYQFDATLIDRLKIRSDGETKPVTDNKTPLGRLKNRRVDIYFEGEFDAIKDKNKPTVNKTETQSTSNSLWRVNKNVFAFFTRRDQFSPNFKFTTKK